MSKNMRDLEAVMNIRADFDQFVKEGDEMNAKAAINIMGDKGEELEALKMFQEFNRVFRNEEKEKHVEEEEHSMDIDSGITGGAFGHE